MWQLVGDVGPDYTNSTCANNSVAFRNIIALIGGVGSAGVVICIVSTLLILSLKAYKLFTDRLVLYIMMAATLYSLCAALQLIGLSTREKSPRVYKGVCETIGYLSIYSLLVQVSLHGLMSLHLLLFAVFRFRVGTYEKSIIGALFLLPLVVAAIPFTTKSYGPSVAWCWIKSHSYDHHEATPFVEQLVLGYAPQLIVTTFSLCVAVTTACVICRKTGASREHKLAVRNTLHLVIYPLVIELVCLIGLTNRVYHYIIADPYCQLILWYSAAAFVPIKGIVIAVTFLTHMCLASWRRKKKIIRRETDTWYCVPNEFTSDEEPLIIQSPQKHTACEVIFDQ